MIGIIFLKFVQREFLQEGKLLTDATLKFCQSKLMICIIKEPQTALSLSEPIINIIGFLALVVVVDLH